VSFHDADGRLRSIPASWTRAVAPDPFVLVSAGRALFRTEDLLRLLALVRGEAADAGSEGERDCPREGVK
jgi:hypothetical protein